MIAPSFNKSSLNADILLFTSTINVYVQNIITPNTPTEPEKENNTENNNTNTETTPETNTPTDTNTENTPPTDTTTPTE